MTGKRIVKKIKKAKAKEERTDFSQKPDIDLSNKKKLESKIMANKRIHITKVVSRNFIMDFWAQIQNFIGSNLKSYEQMVDKAFEQIDDELVENEITLAWYRHEITQLTNGAVVVVLYGEAK